MKYLNPHLVSQMGGLSRVCWIRLALLVFAWCSSGIGWAEPLPQQDVNEISRVGAERGYSQEDISRLLSQVEHAGDRGLPQRPVLNKIKEGLAKGVPPSRINPVLRDMVKNLNEARTVLQEVSRGGQGTGERRGSQRATEVMAEALSRGVSLEEVRRLGSSSGRGKGQLDQDTIAFGAKGLALTKEAGVSGKDGVPLVGEALKQGLRPSEILNLGREIKKRRRVLKGDPARLQDIKKALERGERPDRIFRDKRADRSGRGSGGDGKKSNRADQDRVRQRKDSSGSGSGREQQDRLEPRERTDRSERPRRIERPDRSDHSGKGR